MIEYANDSVIKLLKQYDMLAKSLNLISDVTQKNDICTQMTRIIEEVLTITNSIYEKKYKQVVSVSVYLMDDERNRLSELINLINERRVYVNNQIISNRELTGVSIETPSVLGEEKLEEYKNSLKLIDRYKSNIQLEAALKDEIQNLETTIKKANNKINNNKNINRQLEERMIRIVGNALEKLSLFELKNREKEIDLAYTELGYSLEKAKENAKIARRDCTEDIILECDNILASTTLDYERYKEKKLILKLIYLYKEPVNGYDELLSKREEINNILLNITSSEFYSLVGSELNKQYSTIKLEAQDVATLKSLSQEREIKIQKLKQVREENNSDSVKGLLSTLLENEKKHQAMLEEEKKKRERERLEREKKEEQKKLEEMARRQKALEEERNKEIERRTRQLLDEKRNPIFNSSRDQKVDVKKKPEVIFKKEVGNKSVISNNESIVSDKEKNYSNESRIKSSNITSSVKNDFFSVKRENPKVVDSGIPVVKNNRVVTSRVDVKKDNHLFPDIPTEKKNNIFPNIDVKENKSSFFDENEFNDLSNYMEGSKKKNWF